MSSLNDITLFIAGSGRHHDGVWWLPFGLLWVAVLGAAIWFVVRNARPRGPSATEILAERYARGELGGEEYRERLDELRSNR